MSRPSRRASRPRSGAAPPRGRRVVLSVGPAREQARAHARVIAALGSSTMPGSKWCAGMGRNTGRCRTANGGSSRGTMQPTSEPCSLRARRGVRPRPIDSGRGRAHGRAPVGARLPPHRAPSAPGQGSRSPGRAHRLPGPWPSSLSGGAQHPGPGADASRARREGPPPPPPAGPGHRRRTPVAAEKFNQISAILSARRAGIDTDAALRRRLAQARLIRTTMTRQGFAKLLVQLGV
jgi:hypothetical protein